MEDDTTKQSVLQQAIAEAEAKLQRLQAKIENKDTEISNKTKVVAQLDHDIQLMARQRRNRKKQTQNGPPQLPARQQPQASENCSTAQDRPGSQQAQSAPVRQWSIPGPHQAPPRAPLGASVPLNLAWTHNQGGGIRGWGRTKLQAQQLQETSTTPVVAAGAVAPRALVQKWQGKKLRLFSYGETKSAPVPDFFAPEEDTAPQHVEKVEQKGFWDETGAFIEKGSKDDEDKVQEQGESDYESDW
ncbi:hypothetical protein EDC01DRAFT_781516 [Geopyxis carbonaria]|nr:hypothetical protein EDC01DRAFT_781516 [Geopyxis carbonaria]